MKIFKKLFFLYRSKAPLVIYLSFFKSKLTNIFFKAKIKEKKRQHKSFLIKKKITKDYFSSHANNFFEIAQKFIKLLP